MKSSSSLYLRPVDSLGSILLTFGLRSDLWPHRGSPVCIYVNHPFLTCCNSYNLAEKHLPKGKVVYLNVLLPFFTKGNYFC